MMVYVKPILKCHTWCNKNSCFPGQTFNHILYCSPWVKIDISSFDCLTKSQFTSLKVKWSRSLCYMIASNIVISTSLNVSLSLWNDNIKWITFLIVRSMCLRQLLHSHKYFSYHIGNLFMFFQMLLS